MKLWIATMCSLSVAAAAEPSTVPPAGVARARLPGPPASMAFRLTNQPHAPVEYSHIIDPVLGDGYGLVGASAAGVRPSLVTAVYARLIAARQRADGHWETVDVRPPQSYSPVTATAIALRTVLLYGHPSQKADIDARVASARGWLLSQKPHVTEERVYQLLGAYWAAALTAADPAGIEPWTETMLFGSTADVKKMLDTGFNPNSATKAAASRP